VNKKTQKQEQHIEILEKSQQLTERRQFAGKIATADIVNIS